MHLDDRTRLLHMVDAAQDVISFAAGVSRSSLDQNKMLALALVRCIEIIGEAANGLSENLRSLHPEIPWPQIIAMRNRLIHGYFEVDLDRLWDTVTSNIPELIAKLKPLAG